MKTLTIYGHSDDLIETSGLPGCDEFDVYGNNPYHGALTIKSSESEIRVHCIYDGHWCFAIGPLDGDYDKMPNWPIRRTWAANNPYSETVEIDCPDDAVLLFNKS